MWRIALWECDKAVEQWPFILRQVGFERWGNPWWKHHSRWKFDAVRLARSSPLIHWSISNVAGKSRSRWAENPSGGQFSNLKGAAWTKKKKKMAKWDPWLHPWWSTSTSQDSPNHVCFGRFLTRELVPVCQMCCRLKTVVVSKQITIKCRRKKPSRPDGFSQTYTTCRRPRSATLAEMYQWSTDWEKPGHHRTKNPPFQTMTVRWRSWTLPMTFMYLLRPLRLIRKSCQHCISAKGIGTWKDG